MKKLLLIFLSCGFLFLCASGAQATPIKVGDEVHFTDYGAPVGTIGSAGEFTWVEKSNAYTWSSFCVELNEHVSQGTNYKVDGLSETTTTGKALTQETAWLFWNFANGDLEKYGTADASDPYRYEQDLQALIWNFQTEITDAKFDDYVYNNSYGSVYLFGDGGQFEGWIQQATNAIDGGWKNNGRVKIVNFIGHQDQLVIAPVPEPATMVLFGIGLLGLAGIGRKRIQK